MIKSRSYFLIVIGLTTISIMAGFEFYYRIFDLKTAILCCVVFESIRLFCVWSFMAKGWLRNLILVVPLYFIIMLTCVFAGINSFYTQINYKEAQVNRDKNQLIEKSIKLVKEYYIKDYNNKEKNLKKQFIDAERKYAWGNSDYWLNRSLQLKNQLVELEMKMESDLESVNTNYFDYAFRLGIGDSLQIVNKEILSNSTSDIFGINSSDAKKLIATIIIICVELGIILITILSMTSVSKRSKTIISKRDINKFIKKINSKGEIPQLKDLSKKQREIYKLIKTKKEQ